MKTHDERLGRQDSGFIKQDLEAWMRKKCASRGIRDERHKISDTKFNYIDFFVQSQLLEEDSDFIRATRLIANYREISQLNSLHDLFVGHWNTLPDDLSKIDEKINNRSFVANTKLPFVNPHAPPNNFKSSVLLHFSRLSNFGYRVTSLYFDSNFTRFSDIYQISSKYYGYLMPTYIDEAEIGGMITLFERSRYRNQGVLIQTMSHFAYKLDSGAFHTMPVNDTMHSFEDAVDFANNESLASIFSVDENGEDVLDPTEYLSGMKIISHLVRPPSSIAYYEKELSDWELQIINSLWDQYLLW